MSFFDTKRLARAAAILMALGLISCAAASHSSKYAQAVAMRRTPVFAHGPAQSKGPDFELASGQRVSLLSIAYGYAYIRTGEGQTGYVSKNTLRPAPDLPLPPIARGHSIAAINPNLPDRGRVQITPGSPLFDVSDFGDALPKGAAGDPSAKPAFKFRADADLR